MVSLIIAAPQQAQWLSKQLNPHLPQPPVFTDSKARPINLQQIQQQIPYLETARRSGIMGTVNLKIYVDANGNYAGHEVIGLAHPLLKLPCEAYVRLLQFRPATQMGRKTGGTYIFRHSFGNTNQEETNY